MKASVQQLDGITRTPLDDWLFDMDYASRILRDQLKTATLEGFGLADKALATGASGAIVHYVRQTQKAALEHINTLTCQETAPILFWIPQRFAIWSFSSRLPAKQRTVSWDSTVRVAPAWVPGCFEDG
jgi:hypothetical protein